MSKEEIMRLISCEELKEKLDRKDDFRLVTVLDKDAFRAKRIPGSLHIFWSEISQGLLNLEDEIVVYCSNEACVASLNAWKMLDAGGYKNVCRFAGGILEWEGAGYPLEGEMVK
jgi:rhodanese-related sulfurtransferase